MIDEKQILEGKKLIAEFMGYNVRTTGDTTSDSRFGGGIWNLYSKDGVTTDDVFYDSDWNSLFTVIDKINGMGKEYSFATFKNYVSLTVERTVKKMYKDFSFAHAEYITANQTGKEAAFLLLVKFIKWHNENIVKEVEA